MPRILPLPGPLDADPTRELSQLAKGNPELRGQVNPTAILANQMLDSVMELVPRGDYDNRILDWIKGWDQPTVAAVASLFRRATEISPINLRNEILVERLDAGMVEIARSVHETAIATANEHRDASRHLTRLIEHLNDGMREIARSVNDASQALDDETSDPRFTLALLVGALDAGLADINRAVREAEEAEEGSIDARWHLTTLIKHVERVIALVNEASER